MVPSGECTHTERVFFASMAHGWIPLNAKLKARGSLGTDKCPVCGREKEDQQHFIYCAEYETQSQAKIRKNIERTKQKIHAENGVAELLRRGLEERTYKRNKVDERSVGESLHLLVQQQNKIGWQHLWCGRWAEGWGSEGLEEDTDKVKARRRKWVKHIIGDLWRYAHGRWRERMQKARMDRHGTEKEGIMEQIDEIYGLRGRLPRRYEFLFRPGRDTLRQSPIAHVKYWVPKLEIILREAWRTERARKEGSI